MAAVDRGLRVRDQGGVVRDGDGRGRVLAVGEDVEAAVRACGRHVLLLRERALEAASCRVTSANPSTVGIGAVGRDVEDADRDLGAQPGAHLRERRARRRWPCSPPCRTPPRASASSGSARRAPAGASRRRTSRRCWHRAKATVEAGNAWAARPSVPAAPAAPPAALEPPQPESTTPTRTSAANAARRRRTSMRRREVMTALYDRRRIARHRREAVSMPNIFEPDFDQRREHPGFRALRARLGWQLATRAPRREHLGDRARRGRLSVPLPPRRGRDPRRPAGTPERPHGRRVARARTGRRAVVPARPSRAPTRSRTGAT